jgi:hypothetical protein
MGPFEALLPHGPGVPRPANIGFHTRFLGLLETKGFDVIAKNMRASKSAPGASMGYPGSHARIYRSPWLHM